MTPKTAKWAIVGYEINFNRHFYSYTPPRPLEDIERDIQDIEADIVRLLGEVTGVAHVASHYPPAVRQERRQPFGQATP